MTHSHLSATTTPVYSSGLRHLPMPLLVQPVEVDAALARLMSPLQPGAASASAHAGTDVLAGDATWGWIEAGANAVEVTEHLLPDGIDFMQFHALLSAVH
ncbi:MAG: hypothetical protein AB9M60_06745 [Leptothrix sp. (in: b-proteobacteria)]